MFSLLHAGRLHFHSFNLTKLTRNSESFACLVKCLPDISYRMADVLPSFIVRRTQVAKCPLLRSINNHIGGRLFIVGHATRSRFSALLFKISSKQLPAVEHPGQLEGCLLFKWALRVWLSWWHPLTFCLQAFKYIFLFVLMCTSTIITITTQCKHINKKGGTDLLYQSSCLPRS